MGWRAATVLGVLVLLIAAGCAEDDPPGWLVELSGTTTTASAVGATTTTASVGGAGATTTTTSAAQPVTALEAGDCVTGEAFGGAEASEATEASVVECTESHDAEVVGLTTYDRGPDASYPGQEEVAAIAEERCATAFEEYVGTPFTDSALKLLTLWPTEDSWANGDREAVCLALSDTAPLTATVTGTAQ